ncbi:P2Y purinoceptor [Pimephales promelas]|nr:P2Y purinoceptor [Pimephales promelas]
MRVYFCTNLRAQSSITVYMKNLAVADFFICLGLLLRIVSSANNSDIMFKIYCSFTGATLYSSILFMDAIAVNRYLKIVQPLESTGLQTVCIARHISAAIWLFMLALSSIYLILIPQNSWGLDQKLDELSCGSQHSLKLSLANKIIRCSYHSVRKSGSEPASAAPGGGRPSPSFHSALLREQNTKLQDIFYGGQQKGKAVSKQRLAHWLVDAIVRAYESQDVPCPPRLTAHSTRSVASSWILAQGASLTDICIAAGWATPNLFTKFYSLRV